MVIVSRTSGAPGGCGISDAKAVVASTAAVEEPGQARHGAGIGSLGRNDY